jgi:predicted PurR-regulated permease PerM
MAEQPRRKHSGVVDDEQVARTQESGQLAHRGVLHAAGAAIEHEQPRRAARDGVLRDQFIGQIELELGRSQPFISAAKSRIIPEMPEAAVKIEPAENPLPPTPGAPDEPPPVVVDVDEVGIRNLPLVVLAVIAVILLLQFASTVFIPVVLAILISYSLAPAVTSMQKRGLPPAVGAGVVLLLLLAALGLGTYTLTGQIGEIVDQIPVAAQRIRQRLQQNRAESGGVVEKVQRAAKAVDKTAAEAAPDTAPSEKSKVTQVEVVQPAFNMMGYLWSGGLTVISLLGQFAMVMFLVFFFLSTGDLYKRKLVKIAGPTLSEKKLTVQILDEINRQIENFMRVQVLTSVLVAIATSVLLWWFGLKQYVVWGLLAGIFNSIPYLGPVLVTGGLGLVAFMQFDNVPKTLTICAGAFIITSLEGFLLTPALMSRAARINSAAIFTGLLFWSWVWGVWGTILAVPMLMMLKAVCDHIEDLQPIGELLGE